MSIVWDGGGVIQYTRQRWEIRTEFLSKNLKISTTWVTNRIWGFTIKIDFREIICLFLDCTSLARVRIQWSVCMTKVLKRVVQYMTDNVLRICKLKAEDVILPVRVESCARHGWIVSEIYRQTFSSVKANTSVTRLLQGRGYLLWEILADNHCEVSEITSSGFAKFI